MKPASHYGYTWLSQGTGLPMGGMGGPMPDMLPRMGGRGHFDRGGGGGGVYGRGSFGRGPHGPPRGMPQMGPMGNGSGLGFGFGDGQSRLLCKCRTCVCSAAAIATLSRSCTCCLTAALHAESWQFRGS